ncbi:sulfurtransferase [Methanothrix soehngenii]|jgi:thiosulfate/3-mercaptopyruvate sulfurtransferase|uniref:sulfurtransferase n=1 Tax=Methanothrix soehngenii TaxID=2223 RepID=UPI0023F12886|nr:rhodanese-like domain-containing protein [Methanothrix soehngenii]MCK9586574.1 rhodanese-like domain-containing protein [Methanothrix soehngenii]MDD5256216.1 rhodanese-like domain-containing protein [Methanothrix soehngenii]
MRLQSDLSAPLAAEGERPSTIGGTAAIAGAIPVLLFILSISFILLAGSASAGTETGEFCPTCPDWTNLDGWLEKKAAYEEDMKNVQQNEMNNNELKIKTAEAEIGLNAGQNSSFSTAYMGNSSNNNASNSISNSTSSALSRSSELVGAIASPNSISSDEVVLDISPSAAAYIEGAVNLNYDLFFSEGGEIVPVPEMARLLGDAGISSNDSLLIAGECLPCGGGPSPAFFTYWALKYLGHEKVRVLEGTIEDWKAAGLNISNTSATRPKAEYIPYIRPELLATYEYVVTGGAQIVDARPANAYELGSIPGAINIPYENVLVNDSMMPKEMLNEHFLDLDKNRSVVVYTNIGVEAALLWFALNESGYDARLYTWRDWLENQPKFPYELAEVSAQPNPVRSGEATTITASLIERAERTNSSQYSSSSANSSANQEPKLTVKGCATCGFGSPQGFANLDRKDGYVQIGSNRKAGQSSASSTNASDQSSSDGILRCTAVIYAPDGGEETRTSLLETSGGRYMGIWNANVAPGVYKVSIVASLDGNAEAFTDVLQVEVTRKG